MSQAIRRGPSVLGLLVLALLLGPASVSQPQGRILFVNTADPSCSGQSPCYTSIQAAVDAAQGGG